MQLFVIRGPTAGCSVKGAWLQRSWIQTCTSAAMSVFSACSLDKHDPEPEPWLANYKQLLTFIHLCGIGGWQTAWFLVIDACEGSLTAAACYIKRLFFFSCTSLFLFKWFTINSKSSPTAGFKLLKSMPHKYQSIIWGQFSLTKRIKPVKLYCT